MFMDHGVLHVGPTPGGMKVEYQVDNGDDEQVTMKLILQTANLTVLQIQEQACRRAAEILVKWADAIQRLPENQPPPPPSA